jgi:DNA-binding NtrC family response regulator
MRDTMTLPDSRPARLVKTSTLARELVGRSVAVARVQELVRRAALVSGGVLLVADPGADVESVAHELHERTKRPAGPSSLRGLCGCGSGPARSAAVRRAACRRAL